MAYYAESLPAWERGLKCFMKYSLNHQEEVAPSMGAWIEIIIDLAEGRTHVVSLPAWERGLK